MRIVAYDELKDPAGFLELMESAFWWAAHPERVAETRRLDARFRDPYGFAMLAGSKPVGFVGVADIPVRTRDRGVEKALGIHHVATHPAYARRGIAARLFDHAEDFYRSRGCRFSFLFTGRTLVAWHLYRKLGYEDLPGPEIAPRACRLFPKRRAKKPARTKIRYGLVERLHAELAGSRYGFAVRNPGWLKALEKTWKPGPGFVVAGRDGYAIVENSRGALWIDEIMARDRAAYVRIINRLLLRKPEVLVDCSVWDPVLSGIYREQGFRFRRQSFGTLMVKPLAGAPARKSFGPRFYFTVVDQF